MYAIISENGRQYKVEEGQILDVDFRDDLSAGDEVQFQQVLAVSGEDGCRIGRPVVEGATVSAKVMGVRQGTKLYIQKFRRRKTYRRKTGHRQLYIRVLIEKIEA